MKIKLIIAAATIIAACNASAQTYTPDNYDKTDKLVQACRMISEMYPDAIDQDRIVDFAIKALFGQLDPHTIYKAQDEPDQSSSYKSTIPTGTGAELRYFDDTLTVVSVKPHSPAYKAGLRQGTQIDSINNEPVTHRIITDDELKAIIESNADSMTVVMLKGKNLKKIYIPISSTTDPSIDALYYPNDSTTYIKISKFTKATGDEFNAALDESGRKKIRNVIIDLRDNSGGSLLACKKICSQIIPALKFMFSTANAHDGVKSEFAEAEGRLQQSRIYIIINENSASASEILAACVQDYDRGVIIGRRSYGKGLTQKVTRMPDGSKITMSNGRIELPSKRTIQKPYTKGNFDEYYKEIETRRLRNEHLCADSIPTQGHQAYKTMNNHRTVYGEMGVIPDLFVPEDSTNAPRRMLDSTAHRRIEDFAYEYVNANRYKLDIEYKNFNAFDKSFVVTDRLSEFASGFIRNVSQIPDDIGAQTPAYNKSSRRNLVVKSYIAKAMFDNNKYWQLLNCYDSDYNAALRLVADPQAYWKLLK